MTPEENVIAHVRPGYAAILNLTPAQRLALDDPLGRLALSHLAHLLAARLDAGLPPAFPLVESFAQRLSRRLLQPLPQRKARAVATRLAETGVIVPVSSYGTKAGGRVILWKVTVAVWVGRKLIRKLFRASGPARPLRFLGSLGSQVSVKRVPWWEHAEMGTHDGRPPPGTPANVEERWRGEGHRKHEARREAVWLAGRAG